jgi:CHAT domain-containing protein
MQMWGLLVQMGFSMRAMELHKAALFYQMEALYVALEMGRPLIISRSYGYLGATYAMLKMYLEAVSEATKAFETGQNVSDSGGFEIMAQASLQLGDIHRQAGDCDQATAAYNKSIQLYGTFGYYSYVAHKGKLLCYIAGSNYGAVREELKTVMDLSESYRRKITTESARVSFFDVEQSVFDLAIQFEFVTMKDPVRAFSYSELSRGRSLGDALHLKAEVLMKSYGPDLRLPTVTNSLSLSELQEKMPEGAQILQYAVLDDRLIMWIVTKAGIHHVEVGVSSQLLTQKVRDYLALVSTRPSGEPSDYLARAEDLYRILVVPAEPFLDKGKFLCVVPDKILHHLPYGALVSPATNKFLIEDYDFGTAPNSSIFAKLSAAAKVKGAPMEETLLSVGNPTFDKTAFESLRDLPSAAREARAVARFYPNHHRLLLSDEARESTIRSEIQGADVIHLAMHYVVNENSAMLSGFPLTPEHPATTLHGDLDGFLQSYEIYQMDLSRARLVVLSACQTGIEQQRLGEGAISAARPFLVAWVPTVVASLWPVDSDASAQLMTNFHSHRIRDKLSTTKALKQAQIEMARGDDADYRHPYYWASFLAIGGQSSY